MWSALDKGSAPVRLDSNKTATRTQRSSARQSTHSFLRRCRPIAISLLLILVHTSVSITIIFILISIQAPHKDRLIICSPL